MSVAPKPAVSVAEALAAAAQDIETAADALLTGLRAEGVPVDSSLLAMASPALTVRPADATGALMAAEMDCEERCLAIRFKPAEYTADERPGQIEQAARLARLAEGAQILRAAIHAAEKRRNPADAARFAAEARRVLVHAASPAALREVPTADLLSELGRRNNAGCP